MNVRKWKKFIWPSKIGIQPKQFKEVYTIHVDHYREVIEFVKAVMGPPLPFRMTNFLTD
jgi:hypothetical protein